MGGLLRRNVKPLLLNDRRRGTNVPMNSNYTGSSTPVTATARRHSALLMV